MLNTYPENITSMYPTQGVYMSGVVGTYQKCPKCGKKFPHSKGEFPIVCRACMTQPTKYFIAFKWKGKPDRIYRDRSGKPFHSWVHVSATLGEIRSLMARHKIGTGFFEPTAYKQQSGTAFKTFWTEFVERYSGATRSKIDTIHKYHYSDFANFQMRDITARHIDAWWQKIKKKNLSPRYQIDIMTWLKTFFNHAAKVDVVEKCPTFPAPPLLPAPNVEKWLTEVQRVEILTALPEYDRPIFDFLFLTGCRVNEAPALRRSDIDFETGSVTIRHTVTRDGSIGPVKNRKPRVIRLSNALRQCLQGRLIGIKDDWVFVNKWGRRYSDDYLRETFERACIKAGVEPIPLKNATRHSFGMRLVVLGLDGWRISKIMNQSSMRITEHYVKVLEGNAEEIYGRAEIELSGSANKKVTKGR